MLLLKSMQTFYKTLTQKQAEAITTIPDQCLAGNHNPKMYIYGKGPFKKMSKLLWLGEVSKQRSIITDAFGIPPRAFNDSLLKMYADITKQDVLLGNYIVRSRTARYVYVYRPCAVRPRTQACHLAMWKTILHTCACTHIV